MCDFSAVVNEYNLNEFMWIGDIFYSDEYCSEWYQFKAIQNAVDEFGLPEQGVST